MACIIWDYTGAFGKQQSFVSAHVDTLRMGGGLMRFFVAIVPSDHQRRNGPVMQVCDDPSSSPQTMSRRALQSRFLNRRSQQITASWGCCS
jgi:hypothetical protein